MCLFVFRSTSYYQVKQRLLYKIKTLFQFLLIVKPFVAAIKTIKNQEQYASSYIVICPDANPVFKPECAIG